MIRSTFLLKIFPNAVTGLRLPSILSAAAEQILQSGGANVSVWQAEDLIFGYYETESPGAHGDLLRGVFETELSDCVQIISSPGNMRLMYKAIGTPRSDKHMVRHRVFLTRLKPNCAEEYKRRHDGIAPNPDSVERNFTIWNGGDYICGYCEIDSECAERVVDVQWELNMLQIMDWLTDDVDEISGGHHAPVRCIYKSY